ncbi:Mobilization protein A [Roseibaca ekhonensis]|uniref:Mobilization protein A n=1 Tax=Roseinatronobacter ekhonensis TaxID=254356 RepID=A0A3B0MEK3_9RHOB|nr:Mobilization protein A [Roseibaca ekhonensis]
MCAFRFYKTEEGRAASVADYRLSAQIIKRSEGKSAIASAAYRSASRLYDERTGEAHDYGRKAGVIHCEIITPDNSPEWMHDRAQLWNAVEAVERRGDAQLAREIQLSLPHELDREQRLELARGFVQEQFVNQGMIADVAIHEPSGHGGDDRNHHAHVMLTMRELTSDGFGKKNRDWNSPDNLTNWREQWAHHQNRQLERHGHQARVDHRSYEAQGVDREPTQHLGPTANDMEKKGKRSRIGDENRERQERNQLRAQMYAEQFAVQQEISLRQSNFEKWKDRKQQELEAALDLQGLDLSQKHDRRRGNLERELADTYGTPKATIKAELETIERKLQAKGVRKILRDVFGKTRHDSTHREDLAATLRSMEQRENEQRNKLERHINLEKKRHNERMDGLRAKSNTSIERRKEQLKGRAKAERSATPTTAPFIDRAKSAAPDFKRANDNAPQTPNKARTEAKAKSRPPVPNKSPAPSQRENLAPPEPSDRLSLDERKQINDTRLDGEKKPPKPWQRELGTNDNKRPWTRERGEGIERKPKSPRGGGKNTPS